MDLWSGFILNHHSAQDLDERVVNLSTQGKSGVYNFAI